MTFPNDWAFKVDTQIDASDTYTIDGPHVGIVLKVTATAFPDAWITFGGGDEKARDSIRFRSDEFGATELPLYISEWSLDPDPANSVILFHVRPDRGIPSLPISSDLHQTGRV